MGFGGLATTIILFIAVMLVSTGVIMSLQTQVTQSQSSMRSQAELLNNQISTNVDITSANYTGGVTTIYVLNNGKTILDVDNVDVYIDNLFIPRNTSNRTMAVESSTDLTNPGLWDPTEILRIDVTKTLGNGTHKVKVATQYGSLEQETFSV